MVESVVQCGLSTFAVVFCAERTTFNRSSSVATSALLAVDSCAPRRSSRVRLISSDIIAMLTLVVTASPATISTTMNECRLRADSQTIDATDFMRERDSIF